MKSRDVLLGTLFSPALLAFGSVGMVLMFAIWIGFGLWFAWNLWQLFDISA